MIKRMSNTGSLRAFAHASLAPLSTAILLIVAVLGNPTSLRCDTPSVTRGRATTTATNLYPGCAGSRVTALGSIKASDGTEWTVPAQTEFIGGRRLPDLYNQCSGVMPANIAAVNLDALPVVVIDSSGEVITAYMLGDNYYELYINGVLVGVDPVPYTPFNSSVVKFKVSRPYTVAVKLVDWEENMGLGTENNNGNLYHPGDGGFIAAFSDGTVTSKSWKAQTFYIAPLENSAVVNVLPDGTRSTSSASVKPTCADSCYGVHYPLPASWLLPSFDDSMWPSATEYTAQTVGVNFPAYTNVQSVWNNSRFIWSSNLILDNLVCLRTTVGSTSGVGQENDLRGDEQSVRAMYADRTIQLISSVTIERASLQVISLTGNVVVDARDVSLTAHLPVTVPASLPAGVYIIDLRSGTNRSMCTVVVQ